MVIKAGVNPPDLYKQIEGTRSNDGRCDREGRFVVGGFNGVNEGKENWARCLPTYSVTYNKSTEGLNIKIIDVPLVRYKILYELIRENIRYPIYLSFISGTLFLDAQILYALVLTVTECFIQTAHPEK